MMDKAILLVEDNPDDAELTIHALKSHNLANEIVIAEDGEKALDYLFATGEFSERDAEDIPSLILLDLNLPKINGLQVLERLRENKTTKRVPVVVLTTSNDESDVLHSYDLGVNSYLRKPVNFDQFLDMAKQMGMYWLMMNVEPPR